MDFEMGEADGGAVEVDFLCVEVDLDYEFDAARFFDFCRAESDMEFREAELWFESAGSYPPSPFIATMKAWTDVAGENVNTLPKYKDEDKSNTLIIQGEFNMGVEYSELDKKDKGLGVHRHTSQSMRKGMKKSFAAGPFLRGSTLMKPTASQLAKQNKPQEVKNSSESFLRHQKLLVGKSEKSSEDPFGNVYQAAKRQKLEGGHLFKVADSKQQMDLIHKVPQKNSRLKLTIPREPELETAQRAQRVRIQVHRTKTANPTQDGMTPASSAFKARPLNRKILEAPSLPLHQKSKPQLGVDNSSSHIMQHSCIYDEFKLMTSERAIQHSLAAPSSIANSCASNCASEICSVGSRRLPCQHSSTLQLQKSAKLDGSGVVAKFKARPLEKKIFSSKGDIGVFRSIKQETTTPKEFNFETNKRLQQNPPIDLFSKLSLNSEAQQSNASLVIISQSIPVINKGSKENIIKLPRQEPKRETFRNFEGQCTQAGSAVSSSFRTQANTFRSLGIR
ncbi:protein TPX2-like [Dioscorea cayenensis subsp. rotundata]|uniref:Protein TPX2-like n=1 Tax=Dioscorea cayennensis subsp. rotundata TaxID=55577 RepID=A0AB40BGV3_DIOCR|nr:protein TPX2-like [Dioscorea cayenensis subsp. rotundata]